MSDGTVLSAAVGTGDTIATDDISGVKYPRSKITIGADGTNDGDVSSANPLPASLRSEQVDDAAFTPATSRVTMVGATFDDSSPDTVNEGDGGAVRMSANRNLYATIRDAAGNERGLNVDASGNIGVTDASGSLTVDGTVTANAGSGTFVVGDGGSSLSIDDNSGSITVDGTVAISGTVAVTDNSGSLTVDGTVAVSSVTTSVTPGTSAAHLGKAEDAVHGSGDTGVMVLGVRNDAGTALAADGDYIPLSIDSAGAVRVTGGGGGTQYTEADTDASITGTAVLWEDTSDTLRAVSAAKPLPVNVVAGSTSGTEYTEGDTDVSISGTAILWEDGSDTLRAVSAAKPLPIGDAGGSLTVDGTVAVSALPASTNTIEVVGDVAHDAVAAGNPVLVGAYAKATAPTDVSADGDAVRIWADLAGRVQVGDGGGLLSVDDGAGSLTVDGTVAVSSVTTSVTPGTSAAHLGKAEDAVHSSGDTGVMALAVRSDTAAATGADGDYVPLLTDSAGKLHVNVGNTVTVGSHAVTNAGTFAVQVDGSALTSLQLIDDVVFAEDLAASSGDKGVQVLAVRRDTAASSSTTDGDYSTINTDASGRLWVNASGAAVPVTDNSGSLTVDNGGTFAVQDSEKIADDAAFTVATTKVVPVGFLADETATDSVDEGDIGAARMTLDRKIHVAAELESSSARAAGTSLTPKFAAIAAASSGDNTLVAAVTSKKIRVLKLMMIAAGAVNAYFTTASSGTVIFGGSTNKIALTTNSGFTLPGGDAFGWFETAAGQALVLNLSGVVAVSGGLVYIEVA